MVGQAQALELAHKRLERFVTLFRKRWSTTSPTRFMICESGAAALQQPFASFFPTRTF